jgi:hypothetical protein
VKQPRIPVSVLLSRIRREIAYLKAVLRNNRIVLPRALALRNRKFEKS